MSAAKTAPTPITAAMKNGKTLHEAALPTESHHPEIFEQITERDHEQVVFCSDKASGLRAIIAIHNTTHGCGLMQMISMR